jgi:hypothetical protein
MLKSNQTLTARPQIVNGMLAMKRNGQSKIESDDKASVIYHVVYSHEGFDESAQILFKLVQRTQKIRPSTTRKLFLLLVVFLIRWHENGTIIFAITLYDF